MRRLFPYLGPGGQANAVATDPFSFTDYRIIPTIAASKLMVERLPFFRLRKKYCAELKDYKEWTVELFKLFINSFFSLEVELTFFDLINYKFILWGNFLHCIRLRICSKCQQTTVSNVLSLALGLRKDTETRKKQHSYSISFTRTFHLAAAFSTLRKWTFLHFLVIYF